MSSPKIFSRPGPFLPDCRLFAWGRVRNGQIMEVKGCQAVVHYRMKWFNRPRNRWERKWLDDVNAAGEVAVVETKVHVRHLTLTARAMNAALSTWTGGIYKVWQDYADLFTNTTPTIDVGLDWRLACLADAIERRYQDGGRKVNGYPMRPSRIGTRTKSMTMSLEEFLDRPGR